MVSTKFRIEVSLQEKGEVGLEKDTWELELYQLCFVSYAHWWVHDNNHATYIPLCVKCVIIIIIMISIMISITITYLALTMGQLLC